MNLVIQSHVTQGLGAEKCSVVAHDWGGPIAWTFAALHPHMVALMIVIVMIIMMMKMIMIMMMKKVIMIRIISSQVENLIICNCPHPIAMKKNQRENWRQMLKSWYMIFFQVSMHFKMQHRTNTDK